MRPVISVILPIFNGEKYLNDSIVSVLTQSYVDYELIMWNDGSTDSSADIISSYKDSRMKVYRNTMNQGLFRSLNLGISKAEGNLIRLWSQDDIMRPHCLETEVEFHTKHPGIGMSYSAFDIMDSSGKILMRTHEDRTPDVVSPELAAQIMFYHGSITGNISNVMIKKSLFGEVGSFREDMMVSGDFEMWVRLSERYPIGFIREPLVFLRTHKGQFSRKRGIGVTFIREDREIFQLLIKRLPAEVVTHAKQYRRRHVYTQYVNYMLHGLLSGDFKTAIKTYFEIQEVDNIVLVIGLWLLTANGRWLKKRPKYVIH